MYHAAAFPRPPSLQRRIGQEPSDQKTGPRSHGVAPYRKNKYFTSAAAPRMSTIRASRRNRLSVQFQTMYVSWSTMSGTRHLANVGRHPQNPACLLSRSDRPSEVPRRDPQHPCHHPRLDRSASRACQKLHCRRHSEERETGHFWKHPPPTSARSRRLYRRRDALDSACHC
jgi:hypothetical protein